jgi:hypothetical protein
MPVQYPIELEGENFQVPEPKDYAREFDRYKVLMSQKYFWANPGFKENRSGD